MVLAVAVAVAGGSSAVMAHLADRVGARGMLWLALVAWSVLLCGLALTQQRWAFVGGARADRGGRVAASTPR